MTIFYYPSLLDALPICFEQHRVTAFAGERTRLIGITRAMVHPRHDGNARRASQLAGRRLRSHFAHSIGRWADERDARGFASQDRKSTRLNSSHKSNSYA